MEANAIAAEQNEVIDSRKLTEPQAPEVTELSVIELAYVGGGTASVSFV